MSRRWFRLSATIAAAVGVASLGLGSQSTKSEFKSFVLKVAPKLASAYAKKDSKFFEKLYAPDFESKDENGVTNGRKVALYLLRYHFNTLQTLTYRTKILSLDASGNMGTVKMMTVLQAVTRGRNGAKGSPIKVTRLEKEVFVKKGDSWMMSLDQDLTKPVLLQPATPMPMKMTPAKKS